MSTRRGPPGSTLSVLVSMAWTPGNPGDSKVSVNDPTGADGSTGGAGQAALEPGHGDGRGPGHGFHRWCWRGRWSGGVPCRHRGGRPVVPVALVRPAPVAATAGRVVWRSIPVAVRVGWVRWFRRHGAAGGSGGSAGPAETAGKGRGCSAGAALVVLRARRDWRQRRHWWFGGDGGAGGTGYFSTTGGLAGLRVWRCWRRRCRCGAGSPGAGSGRTVRRVGARGIRGRGTAGTVETRGANG